MRIAAPEKHNVVSVDIPDRRRVTVSMNTVLTVNTSSVFFKFRKKFLFKRTSQEKLNKLICIYLLETAKIIIHNFPTSNEFAEFCAPSVVACSIVCKAACFAGVWWTVNKSRSTLVTLVSVTGRLLSLFPVQCRDTCATCKWNVSFLAVTTLCAPLLNCSH